MHDVGRYLAIRGLALIGGSSASFSPANTCHAIKRDFKRASQRKDNPMCSAIGPVPERHENQESGFCSSEGESRTCKHFLLFCSLKERVGTSL